MKSTFAISVVVALAVASAVMMHAPTEAPSAASHRFTALGDLAGGAFASAACGISADGSAVVGNSHSEADIQAFRWTRDGGMVGLEFVDAAAASADGSVVIGSRVMICARQSEPVCWTPRGGLQGLGHFTGCNWGGATAVSDDGSIVVGFCGPTLDDRPMAFRWTRESGMAPLEPVPGGVLATEASGVSSDGQVVVGTLECDPARTAAFRWTAASGFASSRSPR